MTTKPKASKAELAEQFRAFIDPDYVITDDETMKPYECDGMSMYCEMPLLVVLPETVEQVQRVMRICNENSVPVVARGAGTGLSAGAMPNKEGVVLSLAKFNRIVEIDPLARTARLQPGVRNLAISEEAAQYGLYYGPDPSSQIACTIGGNVAENSGGVHCLKYGLTVHNILSVEMVTAEGDVVTVGSDGLDSCGMDLLALMTGSEGLLGVVTEVKVKLLPKPEVAQVVMAGFDDVQKGGDAVGGIIAHGIIPGGLEMMDGHAIIAADDFAQAGYPRDAKALLLCEVDGTEEEVHEHIAEAEEVFRKLGATSVRTSQSEEERGLLWKGRKSAFPAVGRISPDYYCMDGTIPRKELPGGVAGDPAATRAMCTSVVDRLCDLHAIDPDAAGLGDLGKGDGYVARQVAGWSRRYRDAKTWNVPSFERVMRWLDAHQPADLATCVIHNDFRLDNVVLAADDPMRVVGVLDWEMATLGDPLADLGYTLIYWAEADDPGEPGMASPTALPGFCSP